LAAKGQYDEILAQADRRGVDRLLSAGGLEELWVLADAARVRGDLGKARRSLAAIRQRFAGTTQAATAAFLIGRMSEGSPAAAVFWHETYLAEAPSGRFAPEAYGRRMVALRKSGNEAAARQAASAYLKSFPKGPYAGVAREMVQ
jgi:TolA-binding protein